MNTFDIFVRMVDIEGQAVVVVSGISVETLEANEELYGQVRMLIKSVMDQHRQHGAVHHKIDTDLISYPLLREDREHVRQLCEHFVGIFPGSDYGPAHIMLADYNLLDHNLDFCVKEIEKSIVEEPDAIERPEAELHATMAFIKLLRRIPTDLRDIHNWAEDFAE